MDTILPTSYVITPRRDAVLECTVILIGNSGVSNAHSKMEILHFNVSRKNASRKLMCNVIQIVNSHLLQSRSNINKNMKKLKREHALGREGGKRARLASKTRHSLKFAGQDPVR